MNVQQVTRHVWRVPLIRPDILNVYICGDTLIDSGGRFARRKLLRLAEDRKLAAHALTHAHPDHQGCSHAVCERFGIPLMCGEGDRGAVETGRLADLLPRPDARLAAITAVLAGPAHHVSRTLTEGDEVGGMKVIETPGHTPGHLAFWGEDDRVLILGDVLFHRNPVTLRKGLTEPFYFATFDRRSNLESARKLAALTPEIICFGHGAPLMDGDKFCRLVADLCQGVG